MPNRILKESICTSDSIEKLSWFEEALFYRLIVNCDDFGRFDGRPAIIKNRLFPLKETLTIKAVSAAINKLETAGLVTLYEFEGKPYLFLPTWNEHQSVRAKRSKYPQPSEVCTRMKASESNCKQMRADVPVIQSNPNPIRESNASNSAERAHAYGEYKWVKLSDAQYGKLLEDLGPEELERCIRYVDESAQSTGNKNKWKDWNLTIRKCHRDGWGVKPVRPNQVQASCKDYGTGDLELFEAILSKI